MAKDPEPHVELIKPMLAKAHDDVSEWPSHEYHAEEKFDGNRLLLYIEKDGIHCITRGDKDVSAHIPWLSNIRIPGWAGTVFDAEAFAPVSERRLWHTRSILGGHPETGIKWQQEHGRIQIRLFDMPRHHVANIAETHNLTARRDELEFLFKHSPLYTLEDVQLARIWQPYMGAYDQLDELYHQILREKGEGLVLKNRNSLYRPGGRDRSWLKIKPRPTFDWVICGFTGGKGKYEDMIGAITYGGYDEFGQLQSIGACSGMTDAQRILFTQHPDHYVGKVIEIAAQEENDPVTHVLRHPAFIRIRDDKSARECIL